MVIWTRKLKLETQFLWAAKDTHAPAEVSLLPICLNKGVSIFLGELWGFDYLFIKIVLNNVLLLVKWFLSGYENTGNMPYLFRRSPMIWSTISGLTKLGYLHYPVGNVIITIMRVNFSLSIYSVERLTYFSILSNITALVHSGTGKPELFQP